MVHGELKRPSCVLHGRGHSRIRAQPDIQPQQGELLLGHFAGGGQHQARALRASARHRGYFGVRRRRAEDHGDAEVRRRRDRRIEAAQ